MKIMKQITCAILLTVTLSVSAQVLPPKQFKKELKKSKGILIDVRTPEEYAAERICGAINISIAEKNFIDRIDSLDKNKNYFVYCGRGKRSARAAIYMKELDFLHVYDLEGGLKAWKEKGLETVTNIEPCKERKF